MLHVPYTHRHPHHRHRHTETHRHTPTHAHTQSGVKIRILTESLKLGERTTIQKVRLSLKFSCELLSPKNITREKWMDPAFTEATVNILPDLVPST